MSVIKLAQRRCPDGAPSKAFAFKNYADTIGTARIAYSTHCVGGISENDFIWAVKIEALCKL